MNLSLFMDRSTFLSALALSIIIFFSGSRPSTVVAQKPPTTVHVGVVLDLQSKRGNSSNSSIYMAIDDFYAQNPNYTTKILLHSRDSESDVIGAASAALDLIKNAQVHAIIGCMTSSQTEFVANLGNKSHVPILSSFATSPILSSTRTPYFVRATVNDSAQVGAIATVVRSFGWRKAIIVYQDTDFGTGIIPSLIDALQQAGATVPYRSVFSSQATDDQITLELKKLKAMQTMVFIVHTTPTFGSSLFAKARELGMMEQGYAWVITDGMASLLSAIDQSVMKYMNGVIGVRPFMPNSKKLEDFVARWSEKSLPEPTFFELWAYDTAWALALAAEEAGSDSFRLGDDGRKADDKYNTTELGSIGLSDAGPGLLRAIRSTRFDGVSGEFELVEGQLQSSAFEIVNIVGGAARVVGSWAPSDSPPWQLNPRLMNTESIVWPGGSTATPMGWQIPAQTGGKKLRVGIPVKKGFKKIVNPEWDPITNKTTVSGYSIEVFEAVMRLLPYSVPYEFVPFGDIIKEEMAGSYDDLVYQVFLQKFDAVVGDVTIIGNRSKYVDFTFPFTENGFTMIVPVKDDGNGIAWTFLKPLSTDLWLGSLGFFVLTGFVVWVLEHRINDEFRGPPLHQLGLIFFFSFSTLVFAHREKLVSNMSRLVVIIWVFVVLILTSSYTASLTSMLTLQQLQPTVVDVNELLKNGDYVGYQNGSCMKARLMRMKFDEAKLVNLSTPEEYENALAKGSKNGGVAAIFDELAYLRLFRAGRCADYALVGSIFKTGGFGFVFPRGSPLVPDVSRAILNLTEGNAILPIETKWFGDPNACQTQTDSSSSTRLEFSRFAGIFLVTGIVSCLALVFFFVHFLYKEKEELEIAATESSLWKRMVACFGHYDSKDLSSHTFRSERTSTMTDGGGSSLTGMSNQRGRVGLQSPLSVSCFSESSNFGPSEEGMYSPGFMSSGTLSPLCELTPRGADVRQRD